MTRLFVPISILSLTLLTFQAKAQKNIRGNYAPINGLNLYYEIHGTGKPLILLHGGGSTIESNYGTLLPMLARSFRVIAVEMQAHGHTADIDREMTFEQDADDVASLVRHLGLSKVCLMGFSNGGTTCLQVAIRHPHLVEKMVLASTLFKRDGMPDTFWDVMRKATVDDMPQSLKDSYLRINPDPEALKKMFDRDATRMLRFEDISEREIKRIKVPCLVINGANDVVTPEHALELSRTLPSAKLAIFPGGHGEYIGEASAGGSPGRMPEVVTALIEEFLY